MKGVEDWRENFKADPIKAIDDVLTGRARFYKRHSASPFMYLWELIGHDEIKQADSAIQAWLTERIGKPMPDDLDIARYSTALAEAFRTIFWLRLAGSQDWCITNEADLWPWLTSFNRSGSRNTLDDFSQIIYSYREQKAAMTPFPCDIPTIKNGKPQ